jgi:hypothetical protein
MARPNVYEAISSLEQARRPDAPKNENLSSAATAEWQQIVKRMPPNFFTVEMFPVLSHLCNHVVYARTLANQLDSFTPAMLKDDEFVDGFLKLLTVYQKESSLIVNLATRLRLTPQSRYVLGSQKVMRESGQDRMALYIDPRRARDDGSK